MIGTCVAIKYQDKLVGIHCSKGRGIILPGGKWEKGETFVQCAKRELFEETGLNGANFKLVFWGESEEGYFTYAFVADIFDFMPKNSSEGEVVLTTWEELKKGRFGGYYELMEQAINNQNRQELLWEKRLTI